MNNRYAFILTYLTSIFIVSSGICQTDTDTRNIAEKAFNKTDAELNQTYQELIRRLTYSQQIKKNLLSDLKEAQRTWILFRDTEANLQAGISSQGGSAYSVDLTAKKTELTERRIRELKSLIKTFSSTEISSKKQIVKTSKKGFDIPKEVTTFVAELITNDPQVSAIYKSLISPTEESAGGHFKVGKLVPIEWQVPRHTVHHNDNISEDNEEYVYLVQQQLIFGYSRGYSVSDNIIARVHVFYDSDEAHKIPTLRLVFEGFLDLILKDH